jgi:hypothetical protein
MKVLSPAVTILLTSHMKPTLHEAIDSVLAQTRLDIHLLVVDSGQWIGRDDELSTYLSDVHRKYSRHPLIEWVTTGEGPTLIRQLCPVGWVTNEVIRAGLIRGRYMCTFYDDDVYEPEFVEEMAGYLDENPDAKAVWCTQDRVRLDRDGTETSLGQIVAGEPKVGAQFDCQVDGAQIMWRREVLNLIGDPWLPEDPANSTCRHSDGIFLDKLGTVCGVVPNLPIFRPLLRHRFTPSSTYSPS